MQDIYRLIIILFLVIFVLAQIFLFISNLSHSFCDPFIFLVCLLIPLHIVFAGDLLDLFAVCVGFFYQGVPFLDIKTSVLVELGLFAADGEVEC